jgi:hypothetical protein
VKLDLIITFASTFIACILALLSSTQGPAEAQRLDRMLNAVDNPVGWSNTPVSGGAPASPAPVGYGPPGSQNPGTLAHPFMNQGAQPWVSRRSTVPAVSTAAPTWSQSTAVEQYPNRLFTRQQVMRTLLEGSGGGGAYSQGGGYSQTGSSDVYANWQTAENQASRAHNFAQQARYGTDKWSRKQYASQAQYAADAARAASDRAYQASQSGSKSACSYAAKARAAADRARADANRANYNANQ